MKYNILFLFSLSEWAERSSVFYLPNSVDCIRIVSRKQTFVKPEDQELTELCFGGVCKMMLKINSVLALSMNCIRLAFDCIQSVVTQQPEQYNNETRLGTMHGLSEFELYLERSSFPFLHKSITKHILLTMNCRTV